MSRERKPNRFGARISSIFNSTDSHHHLEKKSSQASLKPLSHPQLSNKSPFSDISAPTASHVHKTENAASSHTEARSLNIGSRGRDSASGDDSGARDSGARDGYRGQTPASTDVRSLNDLRSLNDTRSLNDSNSLKDYNPGSRRRPASNDQYSDLHRSQRSPDPRPETVGSPNPRPSRRPPPTWPPADPTIPPNTAHSHKVSDDLGDIIGTLEQEIDQMMGSPNLELTSTASLPRQYVPTASSADNVNPLQIRKSPKDFDISRQIRDPEALQSSENSPLRQLHSSRYPNGDFSDFADSAHSLGPRTPKLANKNASEATPAALRSYLAHSYKTRSPGMSSPTNYILGYSPDIDSPANSTPSLPGGLPEASPRLKSPANVMSSSGDVSGYSPHLYDLRNKQAQPQSLRIQSHGYEAYPNDLGMGLFKAEKEADFGSPENNDYASDQKSFNANELSGVVDEYDYGSSASVLNKSDSFARAYTNEPSPHGLESDSISSKQNAYQDDFSSSKQNAYQEDFSSSKQNAYQDDFSSSGEKEALSIASSEQYTQRDRTHVLRSSTSPSEFHIGAPSDLIGDTPNGFQNTFSGPVEAPENEPFFGINAMSDSKPGYVAPESLDGEVESLGQEFRSLGQENTLGQDPFVQDNQSLLQDTRSLDQFDAASYAPSVNRFHRQGSQKTLSSNQRLSENYAAASMQSYPQKSHQRMSSTSSIHSSTSNKHVNLATLKMTFNLRPGEGEHSAYVDTIRRNAGTSYNETGPGNWKLPIGIQPVDKRMMAQLSSQRYNRANMLSSGSRVTKSSGVELKHGHLQPRLLAAEVDEGGDSGSKFGPMDVSSRFGSIEVSSRTKSNGASTQQITPVTSKSSTPSGAQAFVSRANSLERAGTLASVSTSNDVQSSLSKVSGRRESTGSLAESVGSINDSRKVDIYYQHPGYKYNVDKDITEDDDLETDYTHMNGQSDSSDYDEGPRLVLANPDDSDD